MRPARRRFCRSPPAPSFPGPATPPIHLRYSSICVPTPAMTWVAPRVHTHGWTGLSLLWLVSCFLAFKASVQAPPSADTRWGLLRRKAGAESEQQGGGTRGPQPDVAAEEPCASRRGAACFPGWGPGSQIPQAPHTGASAPALEVWWTPV